MEVSSTLKALWAQRKRWARGQGEVPHEHLRPISRWRNYRTWMVGIESLASLVWVVLLAFAWVLVALHLALGGAFALFGFGLPWGIAISIVATLQLAVALRLDFSYDRRALRAFLLGPLYPLAYWLISGAAALSCQTVALVRGPQAQRVV